MGGFPEAAFLVEMNPGADVGINLTGSVASPTSGTGAHGYLPDRPEMRASFFMNDGTGYRYGKESWVDRYAPSRASDRPGPRCELTFRESGRSPRPSVRILHSSGTITPGPDLSFPVAQSTLLGFVKGSKVDPVNSTNPRQIMSKFWFSFSFLGTLLLGP